jgi:hypothetical protein
VAIAIDLVSVTRWQICTVGASQGNAVSKAIIRSTANGFHFNLKEALLLVCHAAVFSVLLACRVPWLAPPPPR